MLETPEPTDRVHEALEGATKAAQELRYSDVLPEHLLLGIVGVPDSLGAKTLKVLGVDVEAVRRELRSGRPEGTEPAPVAMAPETKQILERARSEAQKLNHNYMGTEHLLLALAHSQSGLLEKLDVELDRLEKQITTLLYG